MNNQNNCKNCKNCKEIMEPTNLDKWKFSLIGTFLVILLFNSKIFKITQKLFGKILGNIADNNGCPTFLGYMLHAFVYTLLVRYSMEMDI